MDTNERKSVRADLRFLCYLLFKNAKVQSIEQKEAEETEIERPGTREAHPRFFGVDPRS